MEELKKRDFPTGVDYSIPYDTTTFVRDSIADVPNTLFEAIGAGGPGGAGLPAKLAGLDRAAPGDSRFAGGHLRGDEGVGFLLNNLSLFGLVLAIGIVVDDAIVVVENVDRCIQWDWRRATRYSAMEEVTPAVVAIALGLTAVSCPLPSSAESRDILSAFALTISFSTLFSAFNSLTLSPALLRHPQAACARDRIGSHGIAGFWLVLPRFNRGLGS